MRALIVGVFATVLVSLVGCTNQSPAESVEASLAGGCRVVCPNCHPNEVCPLIACEEHCYPPAHGCVENMMCPIGYVWNSAACTCVGAAH